MWVPSAKQKMDTYCNLAYNPQTVGTAYLKEISGMGFVSPTDQGNFVVRDVILLPQKSGTAHTDFDAEKVMDVMQELMDKGREADLGDMWLWWHSHVAGEPQPSSIDTDTIQRWHDEVGVPKLITVVTNIYGEYTARYDQWEPVRLKRIKLHHGVWIEEKEDDTYTAELLADVAKNVEWGYTYTPYTWDKDHRDLKNKKGSYKGSTYGGKALTAGDKLYDDEDTMLGDMVGMSVIDDDGFPSWLLPEEREEVKAAWDNPDDHRKLSEIVSDILDKDSTISAAQRDKLLQDLEDLEDLEKEGSE
jgi:proteasome lid subunit RPN8/RPN11